MFPVVILVSTVCVVIDLILYIDALPSVKKYAFASGIPRHTRDGGQKRLCESKVK